MKPEDFGLTDAQITAAINGSEADRAAIFDQVVSSGRLEEYLEILEAKRPRGHQVIGSYLRDHRDQRGGIARSH